MIAISAIQSEFGIAPRVFHIANQNVYKYKEYISGDLPRWKWARESSRGKVYKGFNTLGTFAILIV